MSGSNQLTPGFADYVARLENSTGNPAARNPNSSATGDGQFIDSTWLDLLQRYRPDLVAGKSREQLLLLRADPALSREMILAYAKDNTPLLEKAGLPVNDQTLRLMHFGPGNALPILQARPETLVRDILPPDVIAANSTWENMTAQDWIVKNTGSAGSTRTLALAAPEINSIEPPAPRGRQNELNAGAQTRPGTVGSALEALRMLGRAPGQQGAQSNPLMPGEAPPGAPPGAPPDAAQRETLEKQKQQALLAMLVSLGSKAFRPVSYNPFRLMPPPDGTRPQPVMPAPNTLVRPMPIMDRTRGLPGQGDFDAGSAALKGLVRG